jgi:hypothetical protein
MQAEACFATAKQEQREELRFSKLQRITMFWKKQNVHPCKDVQWQYGLKSGKDNGNMQVTALPTLLQ